MRLGVLSASGPIGKVGGRGGGGGCYRLLAQYEKWGEGGWYDRVSGGPGHSTVVEFMCTGIINRQRKHAAIIIKCSPKSYEFIYGRGGGGGGGGGGRGGTCPESPPPGSAAAISPYLPQLFVKIKNLLCKTPLNHANFI